MASVVRLPLELLPCLLVGLLLGVGRPDLPVRLAPLLMRWGIPLSMAALLLRSKLTPSLFKVGCLGLLLPLLSLGILALPPLRERLRESVLLLGAAVGNTGYWGVPVALALLPPQAMAAVVTYDLAGTLVTWGVGPWLLRGLRVGREQQVRTLLGSPAAQGLALALLIARTPWPEQVMQALWWPARMVFWIALALVGMRLGLALRERSLAVSEGLPWAMGFKLFLVPAMAWVLASLLQLPQIDRQVLVLQGAAPTALSVLLLAEGEQAGVALASTLVLLSTLAAMMTVPIWWKILG